MGEVDALNGFMNQLINSEIIVRTGMGARSFHIIVEYRLGFMSS